jgi:hypothetical protein
LSTKIFDLDVHLSGSQPSIVHDKDVAVEKIGSVRGGKGDRTEEVLQLAHPLHGNPAKHSIPFYWIFKIFFIDGPQSKIRRKAVDVDVFRPPFDGKERVNWFTAPPITANNPINPGQPFIRNST